MDGFELTKTIRESEADTSDHMPIVAITASVMKGEIYNCFGSGMVCPYQKLIFAPVIHLSDSIT